MSKQDISKMMGERSPLNTPPREPVQPASFYDTPPQVPVEEVTPLKVVERKNKRTVQPNDRTVRANGTTERSDRTVTHNNDEASVLYELKEGVQDDKRPTERYSFEIFTNQKQQIEDLQYQYKRKTGKKLPSSRIIREALSEYLKKALKALE